MSSHHPPGRSEPRWSELHQPSRRHRAEMPLPIAHRCRDQCNDRCPESDHAPIHGRGEVRAVHPDPLAFDGASAAACSTPLVRHDVTLSGGPPYEVGRPGRQHGTPTRASRRGAPRGGRPAARRRRSSSALRQAPPPLPGRQPSRRRFALGRRRSRSSRDRRPAGPTPGGSGTGVSSWGRTIRSPGSRGNHCDSWRPRVRLRVIAVDGCDRRPVGALVGQCDGGEPLPVGPVATTPYASTASWPAPYRSRSEYVSDDGGSGAGAYELMCWQRGQA